MLVLAALLAVAAVLAHRLGATAWVGTTFSSAEAVRALVTSAGPWAPVVFVAVQAAQVVLAPVPGGVTVVAGTVAFGAWQGLALSLTGAVLGSAALFLVVRRWGRPLAVRLVGPERFERYIGVLDPKGWLLLAILLVPFMPDDVVCALAGLSAVPFRRFLVLVVLGRAPSWAVIAVVTADLATRSSAVVVAALLAVAAVLALGVFHRARLERQLLAWAGRGSSGRGSSG